MTCVEHILNRKGNQVYTITQTATVLEATQVMNEHKIGSLVVNSGDRVAGIFTERDVLRRVVAAQRNPASTLVRDVMTSSVVCCRPETSVQEVRDMIIERRIRHIPVINELDRLVGLVSIGDLNVYRARERQVKIEYLEEYLYGRS